MPRGPLTERFGTLVRELRAQKGFSQEEFALLCGLHRTYVGSIERGEKTVTIETARKLSEALDVPLSEMFARIETRRTEASAGGHERS